MGIVRLHKAIFLLSLAAAMLCWTSCETLKFGRGSGDPDKEPIVLDPVMDDAGEDSLQAPVYSDTVTTKPSDIYQAQERIQIGIMLPFSLDREMLEILGNRDKTLDYQPLISLELYEGIYIALDSLSRLGMNVDVYLYDTKRDPATVRSLLRKGEFREMDLIIGPVFGDCVMEAAEWAKKNKVPLVSPLSTASSTSTPNNYFYLASSGVEQQCARTVNYICEEYRQARVLILHQDKPDEKEAMDLFRQTFREKCPDKPGLVLKSLQTDYQGEDLPDSLSADRQNIVIIPSHDEVFVNSMSRQLSGLVNDYQISVFGMSSWKRFESVSIDYYDKLDLHYSTNYWVDPEDPVSQRFEESFVDAYHAPPSEFAYKGFDLMMYFGSLLHKYGKNFSSQLEKASISERSQELFQFKAVKSEASGLFNKADYYQNETVFIIHYNDFQLHKVE